MLNNRTYSGFITELKDGQVFVFGSNPVGINGNPLKGTGGAALIALKNNWVKQGEKLDNKLSSNGKSWGLTTVAYPGQKRSRSPEQIMKGIHQLYEYARSNPELEFLVAYKATGTVLNGYSHDEMASMFSVLNPPANMVFDVDFLKLMISKLPENVQKPRQPSLF